MKKEKISKIIFLFCVLGCFMISSCGGKDDGNSETNGSNNLGQVVTVPLTSIGAAQKSIDLGLSVKWAEEDYGY